MSSIEKPFLLAATLPVVKLKPLGTSERQKQLIELQDKTKAVKDVKHKIDSGKVWVQHRQRQITKQKE